MNEKSSRPLGISASRKKEAQMLQTDVKSTSSEKNISQNASILLKTAPDDDDVVQLEALYKSAGEQTDGWLSAALLRGTLHECDRLIQENDNKKHEPRTNETSIDEEFSGCTASKCFLRVYMIYATALLDLVQLASEGIDVKVDGKFKSNSYSRENGEDNIEQDSLEDFECSDNSICGKNLSDNTKDEDDNISDETDSKKAIPSIGIRSSTSIILTLIDAAIDRCNAGLVLDPCGSSLKASHSINRSNLQCLRGRAKLTRLIHQARRPYNSIKNTLKSAMKDLDILNSVDTYKNITHILHWISTIGDECEDIIEKKTINDWVASKWYLLLEENELNTEALEGLGFIELSMSNAYLEPIEEMEEIEETETVVQAKTHMNNAISYFMRAYNIQKEKGVSIDLLIMIVEAKISLANLKKEDERPNEYKDALKYLKEISPHQSHRLPKHLWDILNELDTT
ncbi:hypothetical protein PORY_000748 [Pneumocystis oryctolagi]|uniref:Uncharacterized protein n=1 Tax=Pneumocystis oryctolagi TaxID=42067 RepID=A0ACB7CFR3_9ASCO|nr:hypothetical protein PORY_000748 [Pneumocystis oryctolagi]